MSRHHDETTPVLRSLRELFSKEGSWVAHDPAPHSHSHVAQAEDGDWVKPNSDRAVRWTLEGAIVKLTGGVRFAQLPSAVFLDQTPDRHFFLSKLVSDRLMAIHHRDDGHRDLRVHNDVEGREGVLALVDQALALSADDVSAAHEGVNRIAPVPVERRRLLPEPEPVPPMPDEVWDKPMGKRLPDGEWELVVPHDGDYRIQPTVFEVNGKDVEEPAIPGLYPLKEGDVLLTDGLGHLHLIEERDPEVGRWFRYTDVRKFGVQLSELHEENARDRAGHRHVKALAAFAIEQAG